jgi:hypothetical protein
LLPSSVDLCEAKKVTVPCDIIITLQVFLAEEKTYQKARQEKPACRKEDSILCKMHAFAVDIELRALNLLQADPK